MPNPSYLESAGALGMRISTFASRRFVVLFAVDSVPRFGWLWFCRAFVFHEFADPNGVLEPPKETERNLAGQFLDKFLCNKCCAGSVEGLKIAGKSELRKNYVDS